MRVTNIQIQNFRAFSNAGPIALDQINVLIGPNNSGKSTILKALQLMQQGYGEISSDLRVGSSKAQIRIGLANMIGEFQSKGVGTLQIEIISQAENPVPVRMEMKMQMQIPQSHPSTVQQLSESAPKHYIVPFLSKRKTSHYQENIKEEHVKRVYTDMSYLAAKLLHVAHPGYPGFEKYRSACMEILGFVVAATPSQNGLRPKIFLPNSETIDISQMGEGVPHIVSLLADLALSRDKLFLIEEPENDLHPQALKALLDLIIESSKFNQFVISTHSNIVVRHLASVENSKLYSVSSELGKLPTEASIQAIEPTVEARLGVLRELGYSLSDFDLWDGWLILEESSAERIIRDYLIPWFAPKLSRIRTLAVGGISKVEPTFEDFQRLVRFTHLENAYRNFAWVRVDGDVGGNELISKLRKGYSSWSEDRFASFKQDQFERYYPAAFKEEVDRVLSIAEKQKRREEKKRLLDEVRGWLDEDHERGRSALKESAAEIIDDLMLIERQLLDKNHKMN